MRRILLLLLSSLLPVATSSKSPPTGGGERPGTRVVTTKYGSLRGVISTLSNRHLPPVERFLGVPYAGVPSGSLRFMPPVTPPHWKGVRNADRLSQVCPQRLPLVDTSNETEALKRMPAGRLAHLKRLLPFLKNQSEDCLYLNIYAPAGRASPLAVLVFVGGGESYEWDSGNAYDGSVLAAFANILVVTLNFRLGILGFLPALDDSSRGNYGIMDQVAALHWVQENIPQFGGDPKNVTVFGHGHGAAFVNLLMLSPLAKGLFQRAILQSGSALSPWAIARDAPAFTRQVASHLKCPTRDSAALVACLSKRPASAILNAPLRVPDHLSAFGPTVDGVVVPGEPALLMEKDAADMFAKTDLLLGVARVEYYAKFSSLEDRMGIEVGRRDRLLRTLVRNLFNYHLQEIFLTVVNEYTDWSKPDQHPINVLDATADALGDALVVAPLVRAAGHHSRVGGSSTYMYVFMYQTEESFYSQRMGCIGGEDLPYVFGAPLVSALGHFHRNFSRSEAALSEAVMTYWTNFVKYGDPNKSSSGDEEGKGEGTNRGGKSNRFEKINWPLYDSAHQKYLAIAMKPRLRDHYHAHRLSFWLHLIPTLHRAASSGAPYPHHHLLDDHDDPLSYDGVFRLRPPHHASSSSTTAPPFVTVTTTLMSTTTTTTQLMITAANDSLLAMSSSYERESATYNTVLLVTVAFGTCILAINLLICCAIYYRRGGGGGRGAECQQQKTDYQLPPDGVLTSPPGSKLPPSFLTLATLAEAGSLPSKALLPPADSPPPPEAQPLLNRLHHHNHWPPPPPQQQEMRVHHIKDKREETTV